MKTRIQNGLVLRDGKFSSAPLCFANGKILADDGTAADREIDANGNYVTAGFLDLHVHGGAGYDFMDGEEEAFEKIAAFHAKHGTTALCPTTLSGAPEEMDRVFEIYRKLKSRDRAGADFVGLHLEGPYFALSQSGAQDPKYVHPPVREEYEALLNATEDIVRWSAAPETDRDYAFATALRKRNILVSAGHTEADCRQMLCAAKHGYTHMTHFYSCMKSVERVHGIRIAGAVEAAYLCDAITVEVIADGMHLPPELLQLVYQCKGADKTALITDAMRGAGLPNGSTTVLGSKTNGQTVSIARGVAWMPSGEAFAGSVATTDRLVRTVAKDAGIPLADAVKMASETPARILGCTHKGTLAVGMDADIVIFDKQIQMQKVFVRGREIFDRSRSE